jgi:3-oxoacyl-[acyl-carrier-protein] synthase-3
MRIASADLMRMLNTGKPPDWVEKKLGIKSRALSIAMPDGKPVAEVPSAMAGAEIASRQALEMSQTLAEDICHLVLVTCTPDEFNFKYTATSLHKVLGLKPETRVHEIPSGCSGFVEALDTANAYLKGVYPVGSKVLVVATNLTSPFFIDWNRYVVHNEWLSAVIFADGACAVVLQSEEGEAEDGLLITFFEVEGGHPLMRYPAGGVLMPATQETVDKALYAMNAKEVAEHYQSAMARNLQRLCELRPGIKLRELKRIYVHQASPVAVGKFRDFIGFDAEKMPLTGDELGNPAAAITGIMFDQDWRAKRIAPGDMLLFSVVGAGAINGVVLLKL